MMLFGFGRVSGCLGPGGVFFCWDEWREGRTDRQSTSGVGASALRWMWVGVSFLRFVVRGLGDRGCFWIG